MTRRGFFKKWIAILLLLITVSAYGGEGGDLKIVKFLSFHAHKYQDFESGTVVCEAFGEIKNLGAKELKGVRVKVDLLDDANKLVSSEEIDLLPRVIALGNPKGMERPLKNSEIGVFSGNIKECPDRWLEGKIRYRVIETVLGE